jgi:hypothetical protein
MVAPVDDVIAVVAVIFRRSDCSFNAAGCMQLGFSLFAVWIVDIA